MLLSFHSTLTALVFTIAAVAMPTQSFAGTITLPDAKAPNPGDEKTVYVNSGSEDTDVELKPQGTDEVFMAQIQVWIPAQGGVAAHWEDWGTPIEFSPGNAPPITVGGGKRLIAYDIDAVPTDNDHDVELDVTIAE